MFISDFMNVAKIAIIVVLIVFRLIFSVISDRLIPVNPTELEVKKSSQAVISGESFFNLYYALYPHFVSPILLFFEDDRGVYALRWLSSIGSIMIVIISFLITGNIFLSIFLCFQPMNLIVSSMAKPEVFVFGLALFSYIFLIKYRETGDAKYINIGALLSSVCVLLKYYVPTFISYVLCSLFLLIKYNRKDILKFLIYASTPFIAFLPFIIYYNIDFPKVILGYYKSYKPPNPHSYFIPLEGEKNLGSVIFSVSSSFWLLTPYSIFLLLFAFFCARSFWLNFFFFLISFLTLFISWPYFKFSHQYYPITAPLVFAISDSMKRNKKIFAALSFAIIFITAKYKNYNFVWIDKLNLDQDKYLFIIPLSHMELKPRLEALGRRFDFLIYDLPDQSLVSINFSKIKNGEYKKVFFDVIHENIEQSDPHKKYLISYFRRALLQQGLSMTEKVDSLGIISSGLDPFERLTFPIFKNLLFHFMFEVYEKTD